MIPWINSSPITLEYAEELLLMADTGRCAVLDVSEVPKERPTGQSSTFIMMVLGKRFCWNCKKLPIHSIASIAMHCNSGIARECKIATDTTRRHKERKEAGETIFLVRARSVCWSNDKTFRDFCQTFWTTRAIWHRDQSWQAGLETTKFTALGEICVNTCKPSDQLIMTPIDRWLRVHLPQHGKALCVETGGRLHMEWDSSSGEGSLAVHKCESGQF